MSKRKSLAQLNAELLDTRGRLQTILKLSPVGVGVTRLHDGIIVDFNDALLQILGCDSADVVGRKSSELGYWAFPEERQAVFDRLVAGEAIREIPITIRRKDGELRHALFSATTIDLDGEVHFVGHLRDVTNERLAEQAREKVERRLRLSLAAIPVTIFHQDRDLRYTYIINPKIGQPVDAIVGHFDHELFSADDAAVLTATKQRVLDTGIGERLEAPVHLGGRTLWFDTLVEPELGEDGQVSGLICAGTDITERKQREERYRAVLEDQTELIGRYRPDGVMLYVNEVYCRFFGKTEAQLVGNRWHPEAHPDDIPVVEEKLASLSPENPVVTIENRVIGADGAEHWMQFVNRGFFDGNGFLREIQSVGRDISQRKRIENELAASRQELHALFEVADRRREDQRREVAREIHDHLGAALTAIGFRVDMLNEMVGESPALAEEVALISKLVADARKSARDICNALRPPALDDLGLTETCRWYLKDWSNLVGIEAKGRFSRLPLEPGEQLSTDLFRVLQELLTNVARHSGACSIRVSLSSLPSALRLRVADDGHGFDVNSPSSGFGLAGARERMARYGGRVEIESSATGTTVTVTIPQREAP